jgi:hypothetical protein
MKGGWFLLLGGLLVWAAHFLALYIIGEALGASRAARVTIIALSLIAVAADGTIAYHISGRSAETGFERWRRSVVLIGAGLSAIAIVWQTLPVIVSA